MDSALPALFAGALGAPAGWLAGTFQHLLYREDAYRSNPLEGAWGRLARPALAVLFAACWAAAFRPDHYGPWDAAAVAAACGVLLTLASTDFERRRIPNRLIYPAIVLAACLAFSWPDRTASSIAGGAGFAAAVGVGLYMLGIGVGAATGSAATAFGMGDVKLILLMGILLGWPGILTTLFLGLVLGGLPAFALLARGRRRTTYSYGPYLAIAGILALLLPDRFL